MSNRPPLQKRLGQHHLRSASLVDPLLRWLQSVAEDRSPVIEIGPGGGVLTFALLDDGWRTIGWELDPQWAFELRRRALSRGVDGATRRELPVKGRASDQLNDQRLELILGDALDLPWGLLADVAAVVGNLPYNVGTAILQQALADARRGLPLGFMVQLEVAQRICAGPGSKTYGALSVLVGARCSQPRILGRLKPGSFDPPPKVDSAFVGLLLDRPRWEQSDWESFTRLVFEGFSMRRKTVRNALSSRRSSGLDEAFERVGIDPRYRPEQVAVDQWIALHGALHGAPVDAGRGSSAK